MHSIHVDENVFIYWWKYERDLNLGACWNYIAAAYISTLWALHYTRLYTFFPKTYVWCDKFIGYTFCALFIIFQVCMVIRFPQIYNLVIANNGNIWNRK